MPFRIHARDPHGASTAGAGIDRSPEAIAAHLEDAAHSRGHADGIAHPRSERDIAAIVASSPRILPIGAQSSLTGGATPHGDVLVAMTRLTAIHESGQAHIRADAGVPLATLQELLHQRDRWYAPVPTFAGASIGGVVATNAAGAATFKYGATRAWTDGLTVVLACGHVLDIERGGVAADPDAGFEIVCSHGTRNVRPGTYRMPNVAKCSAGYYAATGMDLIDLFIGSEGTLGVVTSARMRVLPEPPAMAFAMVPVSSEESALSLVADLRLAAQETWRTADARGIDIAAIEHLDRRCLQILQEDGVDRRCRIAVPESAALMLLVQMELPPATTAADAFEQIGAAFSVGAPDTPLVRFCRLLVRHRVFDDTELALPGDRRRAEEFLAFREGAPAGVNRRVGEAKRTTDDRIEKTAADMIAPFEAFGEMMRIYREGYERRGLDYAIWGHISDGNVHPNVIPRTFADVVAGREAVLDFGREVARLGGCPLAEHGVGRSAIKQALLRQLYGDRAIAQMRAIKQALDPEWKLSPGVLFERA